MFRGRSAPCPARRGCKEPGSGPPRDKWGSGRRGSTASLCSRARTLGLFASRDAQGRSSDNRPVPIQSPEQLPGVPHTTAPVPAPTGRRDGRIDGRRAALPPAAPRPVQPSPVFSPHNKGWKSGLSPWARSSPPRLPRLFSESPERRRSSAVLDPMSAARRGGKGLLAAPLFS